MKIVKLIATIQLQRELDRGHNKNGEPPVGIRTMICYRSSRCNVEEVRKECKNCTGMMKGRDVLVKEISELLEALIYLF
jgi:hypothetical protein